MSTNTNSAVWVIENREMSISMVSVLPLPDGYINPDFTAITAAEFCGIIASYQIHEILFSNFPPPHICVVFCDGEPEWYNMTFDEWSIFVDEYLGSYISIKESKSKVNWMKEGF